MVRIINPVRKSVFSVRNWHHVNEKFTSLDDLKTKLIDTFTGQVPNTILDFNVGYYEKPGNSKRWIGTSDDLEAMYSLYKPDSTITLWCDGRDENADSATSTSQAKRKISADEVTPVGKRAKKEEEIDEAFKTLQKKHSGNYSTPQLRLWARMYGNGLHDDFDNPPNVPAITGQPVKKKKRKSEPLTEALTGAATAITKMLVAGSASPIRQAASDPRKATGISPASKANLSGQYLQQLGTLQQLRESGVLSEDEFSEQKRLLLCNLRGINAT